MDSGYFDDDIIETMGSAGCQYLINMKKACRRYITLHVSTRSFDLYLPEKTPQMPEFVKVDHKRLCAIEEMMLNLRQACQNHHPLR
jgi:hypothetical protein